MPRDVLRTQLQRYVSRPSRRKTQANLAGSERSPWPYLTWLPFGCTSVATTGNRSTTRPAWRMGDSCRQVSWLTARALPSAFPATLGRRQWHSGGSLPSTVAGAATGSTRMSYRVPSSSPPACACGDTVTPLMRRKSAHLSTQFQDCGKTRPNHETKAQQQSAFSMTPGTENSRALHRPTRCKLAMWQAQPDPAFTILHWAACNGRLSLANYGFSNGAQRVAEIPRDGRPPQSGDANL